MEGIGEFMITNPGQVGATGILVAVVWMILLGKLVPSKVVDFLISERDKTQATNGNLQEVVKKQAEIIETLMETGKTMEHVITSLPAPTSNDSIESEEHR